MHDATKAALERSIEHWEQNAADPLNASTSSDDCALCDMFLMNDCAGCPVGENGHLYCQDSPYVTADEILELFKVGFISDHLFVDVFRRVATAEVKFLKGLRHD